MNGMKNNWKRKKPLTFILIVGVIALIIGVVMFLWNAILPDVLGVSGITYWQAAGITVLCKILFGGFKGGPGKGWEMKRRFKQRLMHMTDEEKATFKSEWKSRCKPK